MTKLADKIRDELKPRLEPDEELRSVGYVASGPLTSGATYWLTSGVAKAATSYFWYVGITQRRAIFLRVKRVRAPGTSDVSTWFATPLKNVEFDNKGMALIVPEEGMAQSFIFGSLNRKQNGLDIDEFKLALSTGLDGGSAGHRGALGDSQLGPADDQGVAKSSAAWHPDPSGRHAHRYWDGLSWIPQVADGAQVPHDALDAPSAATDDAAKARRNPASASTAPGVRRDPNASKRVLRRVLWNVYAVPITLLLALAFISSLTFGRPSAAVRLRDVVFILVIIVPPVVALHLHIWDKRVLNGMAWRFYAFASAVFLFGGILVLPILAGRQPGDVFGLIMLLPLYVALFRYAFRDWTARDPNRLAHAEPQDEAASGSVPRVKSATTYRSQTGGSRMAVSDELHARVLALSMQKRLGRSIDRELDEVMRMCTSEKDKEVVQKLVNVLGLRD